MRVQWWGGPHDGQEIDVPDGTHHVVVALPLPFEWARDDAAPNDPVFMPRRTVPIRESDDGRMWFVWSER
jgi:hypothetical protein